MACTKYLIAVLLLKISLTTVCAQSKNFEFKNSQALPLDSSRMIELTSGYWRVYKEEFKLKDKIRASETSLSMCYYPDGTFFYNGVMGHWTLVEEKYLLHKLDDKDTEVRLNFGGHYAVLDLDSGRLTLSKMLTSTQDMKRTIYMKTSGTLTKNEQPKSGRPYIYKGVMDQTLIDSLSAMDEEQLFNAGFILTPNQTIHILAQDSLYIIPIREK